MEILDATEGGPFPKHEVVLQAYLHFEALTDLDYHYSCVSCGNFPSVVIMDLHKKGAFSMPGMFIHLKKNSLIHIWKCLFKLFSYIFIYYIIYSHIHIFIFILEMFHWTNSL